MNIHDIQIAYYNTKVISLTSNITQVCPCSTLDLISNHHNTENTCIYMYISEPITITDNNIFTINIKKTYPITGPLTSWALLSVDGLMVRSVHGVYWLYFTGIGGERDALYYWRFWYTWSDLIYFVCLQSRFSRPPSFPQVFCSEPLVHWLFAGGAGGWHGCL